MYYVFGYQSLRNASTDKSTLMIRFLIKMIFYLFTKIPTLALHTHIVLIKYHNLKLLKQLEPKYVLFVASCLKSSSTIYNGMIFFVIVLVAVLSLDIFGLIIIFVQIVYVRFSFLINTRDF